MTSSLDLNKTVQGVQSFEETVSTAPSWLPDALKHTAPVIETSATSNAPAPRALARQILIALVLSGVSVSPQPIAPSSWRRGEIAISAESSPESINPELAKHMRQIFEKGASEFFEDGMDSNFAKELLLSVMGHGTTAIDAIAEYLFSSSANSDVGSEALRRLAEINDRRIPASRWALLNRGLRHRSSRVRDGAILGFASLDDPRALDLLKDAQTDETVPELRSLIEKVIEQLGATHGKATAQG